MEEDAPPSAVEVLTERFYRWELRGRGWVEYPFRVELEPPFRPFIAEGPAFPPGFDDARQPTGLSAFVERLTKRRAMPVRREEVREEEALPQPFRLDEALAEFVLVPPPELAVSPREADAWLRSLVTCRYPIGWELTGEAGEVAVQIVCREGDAEQALEVLRTFHPELVARPAERSLRERWRAAGPYAAILEFGLAREVRVPLETPRGFAPDPLTSLVGALSHARDGEIGLLQVLFVHTAAPWPESILEAVVTPDGKPFFANAPEVTARAREKVAAPLVAVAIRVGARAVTADRASKLFRGVAGGLEVVASPSGNELMPLGTEDDDLLEEDLLARTTHRSGMLLSLAELAAFVHVPSESVEAPALLRERERSKAPPAEALGEGVLLGENAHEGETTPVRLATEARLKHVHVIGASGTGKSTLLVNLIVEGIERGEGLGVVDPHGDLIDEVVARLPERRLADVILFDPSLDDGVVGWNMLQATSEGERELLASDLVGVFRRLSTSWGDQMTSVLANAILVFLESEEGGTLLDLRQFLVDQKFRERFLRGVRDPHLRSYWRVEFPMLVGRRPQGPILTRLDTFLRSARVRRIVTERRNQLDFRRIVDEGRVLLAKLAQGALGEENAALLGSLLVSKFHQVTLTRQDVAPEARRPFFLYIDEFHAVATASMASLFTGARKYRLGVVVAHQDLYQLHAALPEVERAVLGNAYTRISFRVGSEDARTLEKGFAFFTAEDLETLETGEAICRLGTRGADFNLRTERPEPVAPEEAARRGEAIRGLAIERWGRAPSEEQEEEPEELGDGAFRTPPQPEERRPEAPQPAPARTTPPPPGSRAPARPQLDKLALDYLTLAASRPFLTTRERNRELGLSAWKGHRVKGALIRSGVVTEVAVNPGGRGERFKLLEVTAEGRDVLAPFGVAPQTGLGRGGVAHQWWTQAIAAWLREQDLMVRVEDDSRGARVDLVFRLRGTDVAVEIEMGEGHAVENIRKDLAAGYATVVTLLEDPEAADRLQARLPPDLQKSARSVRIAALRDYEATLGSLLESSPLLRRPKQDQERTRPGRRRRRPEPPQPARVPVLSGLVEPGALTTPVAAEYLGLSPATLETMRSRGGGPPFVKLGRRVVYRQQDLDEWLAAHRRE